MTRAWTATRCTRCGHEETRYSNVKRCRACHGPIERLAVEDERDAEIAQLRASEAEAWEQAGSDRAELNIVLLEVDRLQERIALAERIVHIARFWACHDAGLLGAIREWEGTR